MGDNEDNDVVTFSSEEIILNCGEVPKLTDLELNLISDDLNYICDQLLFPALMKEKKTAHRLVMDKDIETIIERKNNQLDHALDTSTELINFDERIDQDQIDRFKDLDIVFQDGSNNPKPYLETAVDELDNLLFPTGDRKPIVYDKFTEFESALDRLGDNLERVNGKKESLGTAMQGAYSLITLYYVYIVIMLVLYIGALYDEDGDVAIAERYNIGFVTQLTYTSLVLRFAMHYENYYKITMTEGDLDAGTCDTVSDIIKNVRNIYDDLKCFKDTTENTTKTNCRNKVLLAMYAIYEDKYVKNVFIAAKSEYREAVNSINKFVEKQSKFLLKEDNVDVNFTSDNESLEQVYEVLLHNAGSTLFKDTRNAEARRMDVRDKFQSQDLSHDEFIREKVLGEFIDILSDTDPDTDAGRQTNAGKLQNIIKILSELKKESLPEYYDLLDLVFGIDTVAYFKYSKESYVRNSNDQIQDVTYTVKHQDYFNEVKEKYKLTNTVTFNGDSIDVDVSKNTMLTKVQSRKQSELLLDRAYKEFQNKMRSNLISQEDISENGDYHEVYETIKEFFNEVTVEYMLTKTIVMSFMNAYVKSDEEFSTDPTKRETVTSNIRFIVEAIMNSLQLSNKMRHDLLNLRDVNMNKYISFIKFENKLNQLDRDDLQKLHQYIRQTNKTMRAFRKYVKSEEISYSKKYQVAEIYERGVNDLKWCSLVLIIVYFYDMFYEYTSPKQLGKDLGKFKEQTKKLTGKTMNVFGNITESGRKLLPGSNKKSRTQTEKDTESFETARSQNPAESTEYVSATSRFPGFQGFFNGFGFGNRGATGGMSDSAMEKEGIAKVAASKEGTQKIKETDGTGSEKSKDQPPKTNLELPGLTYDKLQRQIVTIASILVTWLILSTFFESYLIKYKTDINYDKVTNITNTAIFEVEIDKIEKYFNTYLADNSSKNCKALYVQFIKTIEAYEKCNFVKGSFRRTPFPATEMLTNGLILAICIGVFYVAYTGTGMNNRTENEEKLKLILDTIKNIGSDGDKTEIVSDLESNWNQIDKKWIRTYRDKTKFNDNQEKSFQKQLEKYLKRIDKDLKIPRERMDKTNKKKKDIPADTRDIKFNDVKSFIRSIQKKDPQDRKTIYRYVIDFYSPYDRVEGVGDNFRRNDTNINDTTSFYTAENTFVTGPTMGGAAQYGPTVSPAASGVGQFVPQGQPQVIAPIANAQPMYIPPTQNDVTVQQELLQKYTKQRDMLSAQMISMSRDTGYLNFVAAGCIIVFGIYFYDKLRSNTNRYKRLMNSGGTYTKDCTYDY